MMYLLYPSFNLLLMKRILLSLLACGMLVSVYPQNDHQGSCRPVTALGKQMVSANEYRSYSIAGTAGRLWNDPVFTFFAGNAEIPFVVFNDDVGVTGQTETRKIIKTGSDYRSYFGHNAPSEVNFASDWVIFYSAGSKPTGGYSASVTIIIQSQTGLTLKVTTSLDKPGPGCMVTQALTKPHILAKFRAPHPRPQYVQFYKDDKVRNCQ